MDDQKILIIGAGVAGKTLATSLMQNGKVVVGFLDDEVEDSQILGQLKDINSIIEKNSITDVYISIPSAPSKLIRKIVNSINIDSVKISIIPRSFSIISKGFANINDLTDVDILNLIGRQPVKQDFINNSEFIKDKTVIVTGAAGSIGSKLVKLLSQLNPKQIVCVDNWENGIFYLQQDCKQLKNLTYKIADIKRTERIGQILSEFKPDVIFHAAAYKHVPLMQANPIEAFNNNVWGSMNLMQLALKHKVKNFVYVSTDKAVNPVNVMGTTKRLGEMILESLSENQNTTKFSAVRFGNVIQSNGSVMQIFKRQIEHNEPLTVTHKDVTRYFMTIEEAAQLIIQSSLLGKNGEIFVLDMGEPIKVIELAKSLIKLLNKPIEIKIIGLRPGEKMFEELSFNLDNVSKTANDKVFVVKNEKPFDKNKYMQEVNDLISRTISYNIEERELVGILQKMGFPIKNEF